MGALFDEETVLVYPGVRKDKYGDPLPDDGRDPVQVDGVLVALGPAPESESRTRDGVTIEYTLYRVGDFPVTRHDEVEVRGRRFPVVGEPKAWAGAGVVVELRRGEG